MNAVNSLHLTSATDLQAIPTQTPDSPAQPTPVNTPAVTLPSPFKGAQALQQALGDQGNWHNLAQALNTVAQALPENADKNAVLAALKSQQMDIHPVSSYPLQSSQASKPTASLEAFITEKGLALPKTRNHLIYLADAVAQRALQHPLGNFGGGLSWPIPLSVEDQSRIGTLVDKNTADLPGLPLADVRKGALGYLLNAIDPPLATAELQDPAKALEKLVVSPAAQALGQAIQTQLSGIPTATSVNDYVLAAINLGLNHSAILEPRRNSVAGFDLAKEQHWGKPASFIINSLGCHLVSEGKATNATAKLATHLLLVRAAPELLVRDIPASVVYGSQAWANFSIAVAKVEAEAPGTAANMTFAQIMKAVDGSGATAPESAQKAALVDWAIASGVMAKSGDDTYTPTQLETVRTLFNQQQSERMIASGLLDTPTPSRKEIALAKLKQQFGETVPFEEKLLRLDEPGTPYAEPLYNPHRRPAGLHSMLDIAMMELGDTKWKTTDSRIPLEAINAPLKLEVNKAFNHQFAQAIQARQKGIGTTIKHLIAQLPLTDRQNLEHGKLEFFQKKTYALGMNFTSKTLHDKDNTLLVKATGVNGETVYKIDIQKGEISTVPGRELTRKREREANKEEKIEPFTPTNTNEAALNQTPQDGASTTPSSFSSTRTQSIADVFVEHLDIDSKDVVKHAKGASTFDKQKEHEWAVADFFLNLVPLRSAIVNFQNGNYLDGATDLVMDVLGFLTAGAATAAKVAKVGATAASTAVKAAKVAKIIGVGTINAFNPAGGLGDLLVGAGRAMISGAKTTARGVRSVGRAGLSLVSDTINNARGASGNYDLLKAASKEHGPALIGSFQSAGRNIEGVAILRNDNWYHYNPITNQPYGPPIKDFTPIRGSRTHAIAAGGQYERIHAKLYENVINAQTPEKIRDYNRGYINGSLESLPDYYPNISTDELKKLASKPNRSPEEIGTLSKAIKQSQIEDAKYHSYLLMNDVQAPGVKVTPVSQTYYLAHVDITSKGECAGLVNTMALAIQYGKEKQLMKNFYRAADLASPQAIKFNQDLRDFQDIVGRTHTFHMGKTPKKVDYQEIIDDLTNSPTSKTIRIASEDHAMLAGIKVENGKTEWFFYDPDSGFVEFETLRSMQEGLEKTLNSGGIAASQKTSKSQTGAREYHISEFHTGDIVADGVDEFAVANLAMATLP
ncbi:hypothetical protein GNF76_07520 [Pseudomonas sp. CCM 7893]|uniref:Peptidase C58 YopT-type domain-containing protein n=1 Tax=Pseudomonas spelaei TaxID=1055469 RepID=A0A6I3WAD5_9PSED|nr:hypothetical protein [Pseudomonas spelaei]MUF04182.1 hypothetical protein [Pseudomonas spelaei]